MCGVWYDGVWCEGVRVCVYCGVGVCAYCGMEPHLPGDVG